MNLFNKLMMTYIDEETYLAGLLVEKFRNPDFRIPLMYRAWAKSQRWWYVKFATLCNINVEDSEVMASFIEDRVKIGRSFCEGMFAGVMETTKDRQGHHTTTESWH